MFCCTLLYVHSSFAIILMGKRELVALLGLSSWCLVIVVWLFLAVPWVCQRFVVVAFPDHTHLLFLYYLSWPFITISAFLSTEWRLLNECFGIVDQDEIPHNTKTKRSTEKEIQFSLKILTSDPSIYIMCHSKFIILNYSPASQEWQWGHVLFTKLSGTYNW